VDGVLAGTWYEPGRNTSHISATRIHDSRIPHPQKSTIRIRIQQTSTVPTGPSTGMAVYVSARGPRITLEPASLAPAAFQGTSPPPGASTVTNGGDGTLNYTITTTCRG